MVFRSPPWVPQIPFNLPDSIPVGEFILAGNRSLPPQIDVKAPFICALTGQTYSTQEVQDRVECLARGLCKEFGWSPNESSAWDKVVGIFSVNTIDFIILCWAIHRVGGICLLLHSTNSPAQVESHLKRVKCQALFTCEPLISTCNEAVKHLGILPSRLYCLDVPNQLRQNGNTARDMKSLEQLVTEGSVLNPIERLRWESGQGAEQVAYLCPTSGTSGTEKVAKITHFNIIANVVQATTFESTTKKGRTEVGLGILPLSHVYGLVLSHLMVWRGDSMVIHPKFDMQLMLESVSKYRIERLYLIPPIIAALAVNTFLFDMYDVSSVNSIVTGAAPLGKQLAEKLRAVQPSWHLLPGYGLTESACIATYTSTSDVVHGSSGSLLPLFEARLVDEEGLDIESYDCPGEVYLKSPTVIQGYLDDKEANQTLLSQDGWLRTGDIGLFRISPNNAEHLFIVDRVKDMIKVKGMQIAPADIEGHLLLHPAVADAAVIGVEDEIAGERPQAFVARDRKVMTDVGDSELKSSINDHIQAHFSETHWLQGRIVFLDEIPRSQSGKILKKVLKTMTLAG